MGVLQRSVVLPEAPLPGELARPQAETEGWSGLCSGHLKHFYGCSETPTTPQSVAARLTAPLVGEPMGTRCAAKLPFIHVREVSPASIRILCVIVLLLDVDQYKRPLCAACWTSKKASLQ